MSLKEKVSGPETASGGKGEKEAVNDLDYRSNKTQH